MANTNPDYLIGRAEMKHEIITLLETLTQLTLSDEDTESEFGINKLVIAATLRTAIESIGTSAKP
jgi:hypothetical protein